MTEPVLVRRVDLESTRSQAWRLLSVESELSGWLGREVSFEARAGAAGSLVDHDGTRRGLRVDAVEAEHRLQFTWWVEGREAEATTVELLLEMADDERQTTLVVTERPAVAAGGRWCQISPVADAWSDRLLGLELHLLGRAAAFVV